MLRRRRAVASVASLLILTLALGEPPAGAQQLDGVPRVVSLGLVAPSALQPGDLVHASPTIDGAPSFVTVLLVDPYGGTHALQGAPGGEVLGIVPDWWPAGHYALAAIQVTTGTLLGVDAPCFYCYAYYDVIGNRVLEGAYDDGFTGWRSAESPGLPFSRADILAVGADVANDSGDVRIADLESMAVLGGVNGTFPAGAMPRLRLAWGADDIHPYDSGVVTVVSLHHGVADPGDVHTWWFSVEPGARDVTVDLDGLANGRYRVASVSLLTDDHYALDATMEGTSTSPPRIGGGAVRVDLAAMRFAIGVPPDVTPPVLDVPGTLTAEATSAAGAAVTYVAAADDAIDGVVTPRCSPAAGSTFALGTTTVTCTATDWSGNAATRAFDVVVRDTTPPTLTLSGNAGIYDVDAVVSITCTASDAVSKATCTPPSFTASSSSFTVGPHAVTFGASDAAGNRAAATAIFEIKPTVVGMINLTTARVTRQLAGSLEAKLRSGSFQAYRQQLRAQVGKAVSQADADMLTAFSYALT